MLTEEQTQLLFGNNTPSIVGGIFYKPFQIEDNTPTDIYGNKIDLDTLSSYEHEPIYYGSIDRGYESPYIKHFTANTEEIPVKDVAVETPDDMTDAQAVVLQNNPIPEITSSGTPASKPTDTKTTTLLPKDRIERARWWMNQFASFGATPQQQVAIVAAMWTECRMKPQGAVNKEELAGKGNTKPGWAYAGEGSVGFTNWDTKKKYIDLYNADPRRKGPKLSNVKSEYADPNARHIVDLSNEDHALITYLFYKNLLERTKNMNFKDTLGEFYLQKAGRGYAKGAGANVSSYDKAVYVGKKYQEFHAAKPVFAKASKKNTFLTSFKFAENLGAQLGYNFT